MLVITRKIGESIVIDNNIKIVVSDVSNDKVKLAIDAPRDVKIIRNELLEIKNMNLESNSSTNIDTVKKLISDVKKNK